MLYSKLDECYVLYIFQINSLWYTLYLSVRFMVVQPISRTLKFFRFQRWIFIQFKIELGIRLHNKKKNKTQKIRLLEQFRNPIEKSYKEAKSIPPNTEKRLTILNDIIFKIRYSKYTNWNQIYIKNIIFLYIF